jgi:ABC-type sugar transport system ATPase subunit
VGTLSGGNQQKALVARWLLCDPSILLLDDPCRGIDEGAKEDIYRLIRELVASGKSVLLASSELRELVRCSNRILVLNNGCVAAVLEVGEATQEAILTAATHTPPCSSELRARMSP